MPPTAPGTTHASGTHSRFRFGCGCPLRYPDHHGGVTVAHIEVDRHKLRDVNRQSRDDEHLISIWVLVKVSPDGSRRTWQAPASVLSVNVWFPTTPCIATKKLSWGPRASRIKSQSRIRLRFPSREGSIPSPCLCRCSRHWSVDGTSGFVIRRHRFGARRRGVAEGQNQWSRHACQHHKEEPPIGRADQYPFCHKANRRAKCRCTVENPEEAREFFLAHHVAKPDGAHDVKRRRPNTIKHLSQREKAQRRVVASPEEPREGYDEHARDVEDEAAREGSVWTEQKQKRSRNHNKSAVVRRRVTSADPGLHSTPHGWPRSTLSGRSTTR